jgi:hypothetical protein
MQAAAQAAAQAQAGYRFNDLGLRCQDAFDSKLWTSKIECINMNYNYGNYDSK